MNYFTDNETLMAGERDNRERVELLGSNDYRSNEILWNSSNHLLLFTVNGVLDMRFEWTHWHISVIAK